MEQCNPEPYVPKLGSFSEKSQSHHEKSEFISTSNEYLHPINNN